MKDTINLDQQKNFLSNPELDFLYLPTSIEYKRLDGNFNVLLFYDDNETSAYIRVLPRNEPETKINSTVRLQLCHCVFISSAQQ